MANDLDNMIQNLQITNNQGRNRNQNRHLDLANVSELEPKGPRNPGRKSNKKDHKLDVNWGGLYGQLNVILMLIVVTGGAVGFYMYKNLDIGENVKLVDVEINKNQAFAQQASEKIFEKIETVQNSIDEMKLNLDKMNKKLIELDNKVEKVNSLNENAHSSTSHHLIQISKAQILAENASIKQWEKLLAEILKINVILDENIFIATPIMKNNKREIENFL